jgi:hypothetical protein
VGAGVLPNSEFTLASPEVARTLLQAGLWAVTGRQFPVEQAGLPSTGSSSFQEALLRRAVREKMMPMLHVFSQAHDLGLGDVPGRLSRVYGSISQQQYLHLRPVLDSLRLHGIAVALIKGAHLDLSIYEKRFPRVMGDIDLLIHPRDVPEAVQVFKNLGFLQGKLDRQRMEIIPLTELERADIEEDSIELAEFSRWVDVPEMVEYQDVINQYLGYWRMGPVNETFQLVIGYDVHFHLSFDFDLEDIWPALCSIDWPETGPCLAQSLTDMAWYLAARFYHELQLNNAFAMRSFLDVLSIIFRHHEELDWGRIQALAAKYKLQPSLYYTFWHINELLGDLVPSSLLDFLYPLNKDNVRGHDWGDFVPKMLGGVQLAPILSQRFG